MAADELLTAVSGGVRVYDLARPYTVGMPQSPNHPAYWHTLPRRHGDRVRDDGGSAANDLIVMGTHVGTHMDALAHVSQDGLLYGGVEAAAASVRGRFDRLGIDEVPPIVTRGVLLDIPAALGVDACEPGYEITPEDLEAAVFRQGTQPASNDVVLIRSGWGQRWDDGVAYLGHETGVPGVAGAGAQWLAAHAPTAVGADTIAFEHIEPGAGHALLPAHRILLVEAGINLIETLDLEELARDGVHEFTLVVTPLKLVGATGSPVRPVAIVVDS